MVKLLAFVIMLIDHIGLVFFPDISVLHIIGRMAFPLFAWGIAAGFYRTRDKYKYSARILILAVISQIPYSLLFKYDRLNVCFTLFLGLVAIMLITLRINSCIKWVFVTSLLIISHMIKLEYGVYGILTVLLFHIYYDDDLVFIPQGILTLTYVISFKVEPIQLFAALSPIILLYIKNYDFKLNRIFQYSFYPAHLTILYMITYMVPNYLFIGGLP